MVVGTSWIMGPWWGIILLCSRGQGQDPSPSMRCGSGQILHPASSVWRCCSQCNSSTKACQPNQLKDCTCAIPGEYCTKSDCKYCKKHPCSPGQQIHIKGEFLFTFLCKDCEDGTYSDGIDGNCVPWTDCSRSGFLTVRPGNRTHNVLCGLAPLPGPGFLDSYNIPVAILTGLTVVIILIVLFHLVLHIWPVKREPSPKEREPILPLGPGPPDDIGNCPFPEEEWGEKTAEDKVQMGHPWV
ncbi:tumor necrosis factor receptor superfamily member 18 [Monodelphis domestica]|uniref:tumor necrosis factor receptor superfamily member 18 n=1 Tax=Monodelphis domestica TaxID=13616 RepID=UPI0024E1D6E8|nr:tumor necrosis factor receptor superfamily member 18 [Monodelphis domestica]